MINVSTPGKQMSSNVRPIKVENGRVILLDQRKIPDSLEYFDATALDAMCYAIKEMVVRGAPAIGVAAALGLAVEARRLVETGCSADEFFTRLNGARTLLQSTRPTAVNLRWGTDEIYDLAKQLDSSDLKALKHRLMEKAEEMIEVDICINMAIGDYGSTLLRQRSNVLTHCNAGALATCGWGTALGVIRSAVRDGCSLTVYLDETRPRQQGSRLSAWELIQDDITPVLITDSMAGYLMSQRKVDIVITGADRIATNGDTANKIGTYSLAVLAKSHEIPFYIAAPLSTIDPTISSGAEIPIEERDEGEVTIIGGQRICPPGVKILNPAFDITPAALITGIITEIGILYPPFAGSINQALGKQPVPSPV